MVFDDVVDVRNSFYLPSLLDSKRFGLLQAKNALEHLNGFHFQGLYIVVLYHVPASQDAAAATAELARREQELVLAEAVQYQGRGLMGLVPFSHCMCIFLDPGRVLWLIFPSMMYVIVHYHYIFRTTYRICSIRVTGCSFTMPRTWKIRKTAVARYRHVSGGQEGSDSES